MYFFDSADLSCNPVCYSYHRHSKGHIPSDWIKIRENTEVQYIKLNQMNIYLKTPKAAPPWERDKTDIGRWIGGLRLVHHQGSILQVRPSLQLHLPELLKGFHNIHCQNKNLQKCYQVLLIFIFTFPGNIHFIWRVEYLWNVVLEINIGSLNTYTLKM